MRRGLALLLLFAAAMLAPGRVATSDDGLPIDMAEGDECVGVVPHLAADPMRGTITANIVVARDGVTEAAARKIMTTAAKPYARTAAVTPQLTPDVKLNVVAVHDVSKILKGRTVGGFITESKPTGTDLMSQLIRYYRTKYPTLKRHAVHLLTTRDLTDPTIGNAVAGIANCIGGIGTKYAYSMSEVGLAKPFDIGPLKAYTDLDAKLVAHELGHIFGAHHHYANCVEELVPSLLKSEADTCTTMFNDAGLLSLKFGLVETLAIRGFAEAHIAKTNPLP